MSALLLVDIQNDFLPPHGSLAVPGGDKVIPAVLRLLADSTTPFDLVVASQDYHPPHHVSFASSHPNRRPFDTIRLRHPVSDEEIEQELWPDHCVGGTVGAEIEARIAAELGKPGRVSRIVRKGGDINLDAYSAFAKPLRVLETEHSHEHGDTILDSPLTTILKEANITRLVVAGLATDFCVRASVLAALAESAKLPPSDRWEVVVVPEAVRGVYADREASVLAELESQGARIVAIDDILSERGSTR